MTMTMRSGAHSIGFSNCAQYIKGVIAHQTLVTASTGTTIL